MESQYGLAHVWAQGDLVTRAIAGLLVAMSLASWMVIVVKALDLLRLRRQAVQVPLFWDGSDLPTALLQLGADASNPFHQLALAGRDASQHHQSTQARLRDSLNASDWVTRALRQAIDDSTARLQSGLAVLASVGSTAPFVGLFGTVWGIYHALMSIGEAGQATIDKVAGPVGEALIMTALGLAVAIPAVLGYNALVRGNKSVLGRLQRFAHDLHAYFVTGSRVSDNAGGNRVRPMRRPHGNGARQEG